MLQAGQVKGEHSHVFITQPFSLRGTYVRWEERPLSPSQSPGMGMSPGALIAANCEGVLDLVNSKRSLCSSGSSTLLRTSVGCFKLLGKLS